MCGLAAEHGPCFRVVFLSDTCKGKEQVPCFMSDHGQRRVARTEASGYPLERVLWVLSQRTHVNQGLQSALRACVSAYVDLRISIPAAVVSDGRFKCNGTGSRGYSQRVKKDNIVVGIIV